MPRKQAAIKRGHRPQRFPALKGVLGEARESSVDLAESKLMEAHQRQQPDGDYFLP
jgi:hypothetical protein